MSADLFGQGTVPDPADHEARLWNAVQDAGHLACGAWSWSPSDTLRCNCGADLPVQPEPEERNEEAVNG